MIDDPEIKYIPAIREDVAIGIASASYLSNSKGGIILQNSGLGNLINPLTSFNLIYKIPVLIIIGWRGYGGRSNDAPEHWIMGEETTNILDTFATEKSGNSLTISTNTISPGIAPKTLNFLPSNSA